MSETQRAEAWKRAAAPCLKAAVDRSASLTHQLWLAVMLATENLGQPPPTTPTQVLAARDAALAVLGEIQAALQSVKEP